MLPRTMTSTRDSAVCLLASSGIDSSLLIVEALKQDLQVHPLYIKSGFQWEDAEFYHLQKLCQHLAHPKLMPASSMGSSLQPWLKDFWGFGVGFSPPSQSEDSATYIPGRNLWLLCHAAFFCQSRGLKEIWLGILSDQLFQDQKTPFLRGMEEMLTLSMGESFQIRTPFRGKDKNQIIANHPDFPFELTFSCLNPKNLLPCQNCNKCEEKRKAIHFLRKSHASL